MTFRISPPSSYRESALTVTELLAVMAVSAVLMVLIFSTTRSTMEGARSARCVGNLKQLVAGITAYAADHNMRLPNVHTWPQGRLPAWYQALGPYVGGSAPSGPYMGVPPPEDVLGRNFLRCPSAKMPTKSDEYVSYGINYRYVFFTEALNNQDPERMQVYHGSMKLTKVPRNSFLIGDSGSLGYGTQGTIYSPYWWKFNRDNDGDGKNDSNAEVGIGPYNGFSPRHANHGNMALVDGSVRSLTVRQWAENDGGIWGPDSVNP